MVRAVLILGLTLALAGLTTVVQLGWTLPIDLGLNASLTPYRAAALMAVFVWITTLGTGASLIGTAAAASAGLWCLGRGRAVPRLWLAFIGAEATTWTVKFLVDRPRPVFLPGVATASSRSFPSALATATTAVSGTLAWILARERPDRRRAVAVAAAGVIALIAFSRIALSVHYLSDVVAGALVGAIWILVGTTPRGSR